MSRRPGLQDKWRHVVDSLDAIVPIYEEGSRRIALFSDSGMRRDAVAFAVSKGALVLDLGSGTGAMAREVSAAGANPVLVDFSQKMLAASGTGDRVRAVFEHLPFRDGVFDAVVAGFSLRDSRDLVVSVGEVRRVVSKGGRFSFCDLGKSDRFLESVALGFYIRVAAPAVGFLTGGRSGLKFGSLYDTYLLTMTNDSLSGLLRSSFSDVRIVSKSLGGSIVVFCSA